MHENELGVRLLINPNGCVCVCVCYDCYCNANLSGLCLNSRLQILLLAFLKRIRAKTEQTARQQKQPGVDPEPTRVLLSSVSTFRFCHVSTCIQEPRGGRKWDRKNRGGKCCLNLSVSRKLVYLALYVFFFVVDKRL